jgi:mitochondrial fission protein ELM1
MSLKQKEEITIWTFKDGKKGHEKQIEALISEFSLFKKIKLYDFNAWEKHNSVPDIIVGAGNNTHKHMLTAKKEHPTAKTIVLMKPSLRPTQWFDIAIVPDMDTYYLGKPKNVITTKGVLSKYSDSKTKKKTGLIIIGGKSRHYHFRKKVVKQQIEWLINEMFKDYQWKITTSPRSPNLDIPKHSGNAEFYSWKDTEEDWLSKEIKQSEVTFLTPESVSVLYEGLSTNTKVYVFHHEHHTADQYGSEKKTKVTKNIDKLKLQGQIGYIDSKRYMLSRAIKSADLIHPKASEPFCETKRVVKELLEIL